MKKEIKTDFKRLLFWKYFTGEYGTSFSVCFGVSQNRGFFIVSKVEFTQWDILLLKPNSECHTLFQAEPRLESFTENRTVGELTSSILFVSTRVKTVQTPSADLSLISYLWASRCHGLDVMVAAVMDEDISFFLVHKMIYL